MGANDFALASIYISKLCQLQRCQRRCRRRSRRRKRKAIVRNFVDLLRRRQNVKYGYTVIAVSKSTARKKKSMRNELFYFIIILKIGNTHKNSSLPMQFVVL